MRGKELVKILIEKEIARLEKRLTKKNAETKEIIDAPKKILALKKEIERSDTDLKKFAELKIEIRRLFKVMDKNICKSISAETEIAVQIEELKWYLTGIY